MDTIVKPSDPQLLKTAQNFFNNGFAAFERGNFDLAIDLLSKSFKIDPTSFRTRKFLRAASIQRWVRSKPSPVKLKLAEIKGFANCMKLESLVKKGETLEALILSETLIEQAPLSVKYSLMAAKCAMGASQKDVAMMLLELAFQADPDNGALMHALAEIYSMCEEWKKARDIYAALVGKNPSDGKLVSLLKNAEARVTMQAGWEKVANSGGKDGFRELIKNKDEAKRLDMQGKATVAPGDDAEVLIAEQKSKIEREPRNINYYRGLARIYQQLKRYDEAVETLKAAREINSADPELDRLLANVSILAYDARIDSLIREARNEEAENMRLERNQFVFDDLVQRVERYPNDLGLRFELGQQYLMYDAYDDAIQQFQLSQRSPRERTLSLYGLAKCFRAKGQRDMAFMQLETALSQIHVMDDTKKAILFDMGEMSEEAGNIERAYGYYRDVYGADIGYKDIGSKMERIHKLREEKRPQQG